MESCRTESYDIEKEFQIFWKYGGWYDEKNPYYGWSDNIGYGNRTFKEIDKKLEKKVEKKIMRKNLKIIIIC